MLMNANMVISHRAMYKQRDFFALVCALANKKRWHECLDLGGLSAGCRKRPRRGPTLVEYVASIFRASERPNVQSLAGIPNKRWASPRPCEKRLVFLPTLGLSEATKKPYVDDIGRTTITPIAGVFCLTFTSE